MAQKNDAELLTASALAKKLKVPEDQVRQAIEEAGLQPAKVRCGRSYYAVGDLEKVEKRLKS